MLRFVVFKIKNKNVRLRFCKVLTHLLLVIENK